MYTALFCLEYVIDPKDIDIELRIYQSDDILIHNPEVDGIRYIIDKMVAFDKIITKLKIEEGMV